MIKLFASANARVPSHKRNWYAHVDGGGTYTRVNIVDRRSGKTAYQRTFTSADFGSVDDIVVAAFREAGGVPERVVFALAGPCDLESGTVTFSNRDNWPAFTLAGIQERTGTRGKLHNDVELLVADVAKTSDEHLTVIRPGRVWADGRAVVLTLSTGVNPAVVENGRTFATELGNIGVVPLTDDERRYSDFVSKELGVTYPGAEKLIGGAYGFRLGTAWLESLGERPNPETMAILDKLKQEKKGLGPGITGRAGLDPFCDRIVHVLGGLYGSYVRELLVGLQPTGGLHLVGGVNFGALEVFADPRYSPFLERINDSNLPFHDRVSKFAVILNRDPTLSARGAKVLAG